MTLVADMVAAALIVIVLVTLLILWEKVSR